MGIPGQSGRSFDIVRQIASNVVNIFNKRSATCTAPCDGIILKMHYQWTFWMLLGSFSAIWFSWFHRDVITCASHFNAETQVRLDYINICLSYPFLQQSGDRRYILYYRWIHWSLLLMAMFYYVPRKISKVAENIKVKKLFEDLTAASHRYDNIEKEYVERAARYVVFNLKTHNGLFLKYLMSNVVCLCIDVFAFHFFDFVLQGRFKRYVLKTYPFNRDIDDFDDYMSQTFPPFVLCELGQTYQLTNKRKEVLGCHLTVMELYEKVFFVLWIWFIALTIMTFMYNIYLFFFWLPKARVFILKISKPISAKNFKIRSTICRCISDCKVGDIYLLYRLKEHFSHARFYELLIRIADPEFARILLENVSIDPFPNSNVPDVRQRPSKSPIKSYGPNMTGKIEGRLPNSSILVE